MGDALGIAELQKGLPDNPHELAGTLADRAVERYDAKEREIGAEQLRDLERFVMLRVIDTRWMDHLLEMDYLREGIGLRAMGQRDPLVEYKTEAYDMFAALVQARQRGLPPHHPAYRGRGGRAGTACPSGSL